MECFDKVLFFPDKLFYRFHFCSFSHKKHKNFALRLDIFFLDKKKEKAIVVKLILMAKILIQKLESIKTKKTKYCYLREERNKI